MFSSFFSSKEQKLVKKWKKEHEQIVALAHKVIAEYSKNNTDNAKKELKALNVLAIDHIMNEDIEFYRLQKDSKKIDEFIHTDRKNIVYILGSSWSSKVYPKEKYIELIDILGEGTLLVWGSSGERESAQYIANHTDATIVSKLSLGELKALIYRADLVIGGDSGPTHIAWAMGRASITLFGPTPGWRNALETEQNRVISSSSKVDPLKLNRDDYSIAEIKPNTIAKVARELLYGHSHLGRAV